MVGIPALQADEQPSSTLSRTQSNSIKALIPQLRMDRNSLQSIGVRKLWFERERAKRLKEHLRSRVPSGKPTSQENGTPAGITISSSGTGKSLINADSISEETQGHQDRESCCQALLSRSESLHPGKPTSIG